MDRDAALRRARAPFVVGDPLRGISALAVAVAHVVGVAVISWVLDLPPGASYSHQFYGAVGDWVGAQGTAGVSVFFVLSGYLLSRPFVRAAVLGDRRPGLGRFARNRVLRIAPAYWAVLTVLVFAVVLTGLDDASARQMAHLYLFDGGTATRPLPLWMGHVWTLDIEMRFYLGLGVAGTVLVLGLGRGAPGPRAAVVALAAVALAVWSFTSSTHGFDKIGTLANVGRFSIGILLAVAEVSAPRLRATRATAIAAGALFAAGVVALTLVSVGNEDLDQPLGKWAFLLLTLAAGAVVAGPLLWQWAGGAPWRALDNRVLHWAGTRSYSIYLAHVPVYAALMTAFPDEGYKRRTLLLAGTGLPLALVASELLHRYVERPFLRRKAPSQAAPGARVGVE